jgi:protein EFR3
MIQHSNGAQMGFLMQATFEALGDLKVWEEIDQCRWLAQKACEWAQYQYRYAVPTRLVEQLLLIQDSPECTAQHKALAAMVPAVFTSPVPLVNLSTSDIISNLITQVLRRVSIDPDDALLPSLVECISSLGAHIYYSDQIQDLASELISRLVTVEMQGVTGRDKDPDHRRRSQAIRCLLAGLIGLMRAADGSDESLDDRNVQQIIPSSTISTLPNIVPSQALPSHGSRRTKVSGEIWYETLSLLCDGDYSVRSDYAHTLVSYLRQEIPKRGDTTDEHGVRRPRPLVEGSPTHQASSIGLLLFGDSATRSLHATHAYLFILATTPSLGISFSSSPSPAYSTNGDIPTIGITASTPQNETGPNANGFNLQGSSPSRRSPAPLVRTRKSSTAQRLLENVPEKVSASASASLSDYALIQHVLSAIHEEVPTRGLLVGLPMLMALHAATEIENGTNGGPKQRIKVIHELLARVWLVLGRVWECPGLVDLAEKVSFFLKSLETLLMNGISPCQQWKCLQLSLLSRSSFLGS